MRNFSVSDRTPDGFFNHNGRTPPLSSRPQISKGKKYVKP